MNSKKIRIGCASGFWGDTSTAAKQLVEKASLDYLVFDFLAEVTMSILSRAKLKNPKLGYATDFIDQITSLLKKIKDKKIKVITNAGGINPYSCKTALQLEAEKLGLELNIATVEGDNILAELPALRKQGVTEIEKKSILPKQCLSINAERLWVRICIA